MTRSGRLPRLIVMTRYPEPGIAKTRLAAAVGDEEAARLHSDIARYCVRRMHAVAVSGDVELEIRAAGASPGRIRRWLGRQVRVRPQGPGDLGARLADGARTAFAEGAPRIIVVGSDAPDVGGTQVRAALEALDDADVVLGPATDGGYYLAGIDTASRSGAISTLFDSSIPWGTAEVLEATLAAAESAGLEVAQLEELTDIDREEDLAIWDEVLAQEEQARTGPAVSVIIPALDEEAQIADAVASARAADPHEIIVVDGGSADETVPRAEEAGATVVRSPRGRAAQLNVGADRAAGDVLLFLHADSRLPATAVDEVRDTLDDPRVTLGGFKFSAGDPERGRDRFMSWVGRTRHRLFSLPYGDQGQFIRRRDLEDLGGIPPMAVMEDYELALRCKRFGSLGVAPSRLPSSGRAWHEHGIVPVAVVNSAVIVGYRLGVGTETLARWRSAIGPRKMRGS